MLENLTRKVPMTRVILPLTVAGCAIFALGMVTGVAVNDNIYATSSSQASSNDGKPSYKTIPRSDAVTVSEKTQGPTPTGLVVGELRETSCSANLRPVKVKTEGAESYQFVGDTMVTARTVVPKGESKRYSTELHFEKPTTMVQAAYVVDRIDYGYGSDLNTPTHIGTVLDWRPNTADTAFVIDYRAMIRATTVILCTKQ
jgi:hypothetical protein